MVQALGCKDVGIKCDFVARAATVEEVLKIAIAHGQKDHGIGKVSDDRLNELRKLVHSDQ